MGLLDKLLGRDKKAGDLTAQERAASAEDNAAEHEQMAQEQGDQAAQAQADQETS
jgi:hypothetical protein